MQLSHMAIVFPRKMTVSAFLLLAILYENMTVGEVGNVIGLALNFGAARDNLRSRDREMLDENMKIKLTIYFRSPN